MKLSNHKSIIFIVVLMGVFLTINTAIATDVGGIIDTDTTWDLAGSPYNIISDVQVAEGVTLTIDPGVEINTGKIKVWGILSACGTDSSKVVFNSVEMESQIASSELNVEHSKYTGGRIYHENGDILLVDSTIQNLYTFHIRYLQGGRIERNLFIKSGGIHIGHSADVKFYIRNNVFYQQTTNYAISKSFEASHETIAEYNSFLSTDRIALRLEESSLTTPTDITAINNYWNTTDASIIDAMIYDRNDDLGIQEYIEYVPFLTEPHPDTPSPPSK